MLMVSVSPMGTHNQGSTFGPLLLELMKPLLHHWYAHALEQISLTREVSPLMLDKITFVIQQIMMQVINQMLLFMEIHSGMVMAVYQPVAAVVSTLLLGSASN